jgi:hypothetical protein
MRNERDVRLQSVVMAPGRWRAEKSAPITDKGADRPGDPGMV